jgi:uncharacterized protein YjbI with pentapeptide repeats
VSDDRLQTLDPRQFVSGGDFVDVALREAVLDPQPRDGIALENSLLWKVRGPGAALSNLRLSNVDIEDCDFANAAWERLRAAGVRLVKCRLTGWNVADGILRDATFSGSKIDLAVFQRAALHNCIFRRCDLRESDFTAARFKGVRLARCDLRGARLTGVKLAEVDFRGSQLAGAQLDPAALRGAILDPLQLAALADMLGIIVRPDEPEDAGPRDARKTS